MSKEKEELLPLWLTIPWSTLCRPSVDCLHNLSEAGNSFHHTKKKCLSSILWSLVPKFFAGLYLNASIVFLLICVCVQNLQVCL